MDYNDNFIESHTAKQLCIQCKIATLVALCYYQIIEFNALRKKNGFLLKLFRFSISRLLSLSDEALDTHHRLETDKRKHRESHNIYRHISANKPKN